MKLSLLVIQIFFLGSTSLSAATEEIVQCYDFGCKSTRSVEFSQAEWDSIRSTFNPPALSPWLEKQQIRQAIALMEQYSGALTGTYQDKAGNYSGADLPFQQDCIDESTNTFQYLMALQNLELLNWHEVGEKKRRIVWFATHWSAVIRETATQQLYAVDSWYRDNGEPPYIQKLEDWQRKRSFPVSLNP